MNRLVHRTPHGVVLGRRLIIDRAQQAIGGPLLDGCSTVVIETDTEQPDNPRVHYFGGVTVQPSPHRTRAVVIAWRGALTPKPHLWRLPRRLVRMRG